MWFCLRASSGVGKKRIRYGVLKHWSCALCFCCCLSFGLDILLSVYLRMASVFEESHRELKTAVHCQVLFCDWGSSCTVQYLVYIFQLHWRCCPRRTWQLSLRFVKCENPNSMTTVYCGGGADVRWRVGMAKYLCSADERRPTLSRAYLSTRLTSWRSKVYERQS